MRELNKFILIIFAMKLCPRHTMQEYLSREEAIGSPYIQQIMCRDVFL